MSDTTDARIEITDAELERMLAEARALAFPRYPGTEGDRRAIAWVSDRLAEAGLEVAVEEFSYDLRPAWWVLRAALLGAAGLLLVAGLLAPASTALAGAVLAAGLLTGGAVLAWAPGRERLYAGEGPTRTANVSGSRRVGRPRRTVILLAHHDSKSQNLSFPWRMAMTLSAIFCALALLGLLAVTLARGEMPGPAWLAPALGLAGAAALGVLATLKNGNRSPGGVDNAGSVALVLALARLLPPTGPDDVEWIFLSPGAEEDHMIGAMRWLEAHRGELAGREVWALNFDGVGNQGRLALLERFGFGRAFSPALSKLARERAGELGLKVRGVFLPPAMGLDAIPFVHRGIACLTLSSGSLNRATLSVHSAGDRAELLDRETLRRGARLGAAMALALADGEPPRL